jgi:hypothetical protein
VRERIVIVAGLCFVLFGSGGCALHVKGDAMGAACAPDTLCEGLCLLDLPNGMCSRDCSATECPEGYVCSDISEGRYCLATCQADSDCRDGMICVVGACGLARGWGAACEEAADCRSGICYEGPCNVECRRARDCVAPLSCVAVGEGPRCVDHGDWTSPETEAFGESCTMVDCASGFTCLSSTLDPGDDPDAFCTRSCATDFDCPPSMACRRTELPRLNCIGDESCPLRAEKCLSRGPDERGLPYCSDPCSPDDPGSCGEEEVCAEALRCEPDGTWVRQCSQCSDPALCGSAEEGPAYHCFAAEPVLRCVPRTFCEPCAYDSQCPSGGALCVSVDARLGTGRYCSRGCNPERPTTCPVADTTCREVFRCAADRSWVADCAACSDPSTCASAEGGARFQCVPDYGACAGSGSDFCSGCYIDEDCPAGGYCVDNAYGSSRFCTAPCDSIEGGCPSGHDCIDYPGRGPLCFPRTGSCTVPSGFVSTCYACESYWDCTSGQCLPFDLADGRRVCWEECPNGDGDCPIYTQCLTLSSGSTSYNLCGPLETFGLERGCTRVQLCQDECPEGPESCPPDAHEYCL